jgi:hypothetical protein
MAGAVVCCQSLRRLWVAVISRHSLRTAERPRLRKRSQRRLNLVWPKTGFDHALAFGVELAAAVGV